MKTQSDTSLCHPGAVRAAVRASAPSHQAAADPHPLEQFLPISFCAFKSKIVEGATALEWWGRESSVTEVTAPRALLLGRCPLPSPLLPVCPPRGPGAQGLFPTGEPRGARSPEGGWQVPSPQVGWQSLTYSRHRLGYQACRPLRWEL